MRLLVAIPVLMFATQLSAQSSSDTTAIRNIVRGEIDAWNKGDAVAYSRDFAATGTFTNIRGQFFTGYAGYLKQHEVIFQGIFKNTTLKQDVVTRDGLRHLPVNVVAALWSRLRRSVAGMRIVALYSASMISTESARRTFGPSTSGER